MKKMLFVQNKITLVLLMFGILILPACNGTQSDNINVGGAPETVGTTYVKRYQPVRAAFLSGDMEGLKAKMAINAKDEEGNTLSNDENKEQLLLLSSELSLLERGLISLNAGDYNRALMFFDAAEIKMEMNDAAAKSKGDAAGQGFLVAISGMEESSNYYLRGYEKVMLFNYKAMCYMLLGDRKAYNVTRKAIDKQQEEWELFKTRLAELDAENTKSGKEGYTQENMNYKDSRDAYTIESAALLPNAYVNPFGDYMDAMIMEIDSFDDATLRDNARIAYNKVVENNADCTVAEVAAKDMKKKPVRNKKLVHIILADGFSPERQERTTRLNLGGLTAIANYAEATPHKSSVASARVQVGKQKQDMASLSKLESIILRDDQDNMPFRMFMMGMAFLRTGGIDLAAQQLGLGGFGQLFAMGMAEMQKPDTRSWLTLPNKILVARLYVPKNSKTITIETLGADNIVKGTKEIALAEKGPSVIYAVSHNNNLFAYGNISSWINK